MAVQVDLVIPGQQRLVRVFRRLLDGLTGKVDEDLQLAPTDTFNPLRRNQDVLSSPPIFRINDQIANRPRLIVNNKILDVADFPVQRSEEHTSELQSLR